MFGNAMAADQQSRCSPPETSHANLLSASQIAAFQKAAHKSEYETTDAFEQRLRRVFPTDEVRVSVPVLDTRYDANGRVLIADRGSLPLAAGQIFLLGNNPSISPELAEYAPSLAHPIRRYEVLPVSGNSKQGGSYLGQNVFGATATVHTLNQAEIGIGWKEAGPQFNPKADVQIPMSPDEAMRVRSQIHLFLFDKLVSPVFGDGSLHVSATLGSPIDQTLRTTAIIVEPVCAALYNPKSGKTYTSWDATPGLPE